MSNTGERPNDDAEQIVGRERREGVSQLAWCGGGCFDSRRRVNSDVGRRVNINRNLPRRGEGLIRLEEEMPSHPLIGEMQTERRKWARSTRLYGAINVIAR